MHRRIVFQSGGASVRRSGSASLDLQQIQALLQQLFQLVHRTALEEHVPVGTGRLDLLRLGRGALDQRTLESVTARPRTGNLGVVGERYVEFLTVVAALASHAAGCQVVITIGLVADGSQSTTSKYTICHSEVLSIDSRYVRRFHRPVSARPSFVVHPLIYNVVVRPFVPGSPAQIKASYLAGKVG